jgi:predicted nucleotidyltransferase
MSIAEVKAKAVPILRRHGACRAGLFGSVVRGEDRAGSDVDFLVELDGEQSLLDVIGLKQELEEALGRRVDVVEYDAVKPVIRDRVLLGQVSIL